ncbi:uncharacterized protein LOC144708084 isoform X2 [Wolffia australiana]
MADDVFVLYNPHPYRGGYDIQETYGHPLLPSAEICYPISPSIPGYSQNFSAGVLAKSGNDHPPQEDLRPVAVHLDEVILGRCKGKERDPLNWVADYFFTYFRTYGEKRAESFSYGNLNYAYERHQSQEALSVFSVPFESPSFLPEINECSVTPEEELMGVLNIFGEKKIPREDLFVQFETEETGFHDVLQLENRHEQDFAEIGGNQWCRNLDFFGIFDGHERSKTENFPEWEAGDKRQTSGNGDYDEQTCFPRPVEEFNSISEAQSFFDFYGLNDFWGGSVDPNYEH